MQFHNLQPGGTVFMLLKGDSPEYKLEKRVGTFKQASLMANSQNTMASQMQYNNPAMLAQNQVIAPPAMNNLFTILLMVDGEEIEIQGVNPAASFYETSKIFICLSRDDLKKKIESVMEASKDHINNTGKHEKYIAGCEELLRDMDEGLTKAIKSEEKINHLEKSMTDMAASMAQIAETNRLLMLKLEEKEKEKSQPEEKEVKQPTKK